MTEKNSQKDTSNSSELDFSNSGLLRYLHEEKRHSEAQSQKNSAEANQTERDLCSQLMLIATVLLAGNALLIANQSVTQAISALQSVALIVGTSSLVLSIASGIKYYTVIIQFQEKWADINHRLSGVFNNQNFKTWDEAKAELDSINAEGKTSSDKKWLHRCIKLLAIAIVFYLLLAVGIIYNFHFLTQYILTH